MENKTREILLQDFVDNYMEKIFYFYLKKTGNSNDAEDLTQDTALNVVIELNKGTIPSNFPGWIWQIARNRYFKWAKAKHIKNEIITSIDIHNFDIEDNTTLVIDELINDEQLNIRRRELAFIKKVYRDIIVAYYIENRSIKSIADKLSLSLDVVKQRLYRARNTLKEGMNMERTFGKRSYAPEQINFMMSGKDGNKGQPWAIISHLMYKNIFLEAYENPSTAEELALELGIALPYMENELEFLVKEELLIKNGSKYETNFKIISKKEQQVKHEKLKIIQKEITEKMCRLIDLYVKEGKRIDFSNIGYENAKWAILMKTFDILFYISKNHICGDALSQKYFYTYPKRPDDGRWTLEGYEVVDFSKPASVGLHGYQLPDKPELTELFDFGQYKFYSPNLYSNIPMKMKYMEAYTLWLIVNNRLNECDNTYVDDLKNYGYITKENDIIIPTLVIFNNNKEEKQSSEIKSLYDEIIALIQKNPNIERGYIVEQALKDGWLKFDENTLKSVGAYIFK
jgi:RNA polymerase sigma factor (sigma-70 family)